MGTGGGLVHFKKQIEEGNPDLLLFLHGDVASTFPLRELVRFHVENCAHKGTNQLVSIMGTRVHPRDVHNYGCMFLREKDSCPVATETTTDDAADELNKLEVMHYIEKPESDVGSNLINCGIYVLPTSLIDRFQELKAMNLRKNTASIHKRAMSIAPNSYSDVSMERDILANLAGTGSLYCYELCPEIDFWLQIKSSDDVLLASELYMQEKYKKATPELLAKKEDVGCQLIGENVVDRFAQIDPTAKIGPNVSISAEAVIGPGVRIQNAIILEGVTIKANSYISNAIIGWNTAVGKWARITGETETSKHIGYKSTIVGAGCAIAPEVFVRNCVILPHKTVDSNVADRIIL